MIMLISFKSDRFLSQKVKGFQLLEWGEDEGIDYYDILG